MDAGTYRNNDCRREEAMRARFSWCCPPKPFRTENQSWPPAWLTVTGEPRGELLTADLHLPNSNGSWPPVTPSAAQAPFCLAWPKLYNPMLLKFAVLLTIHLSNEDHVYQRRLSS